MLRTVIQWTDVDRAFVVRRSGGEPGLSPSVIAWAARDDGDSGTPSRTALARAVAARRRFVIRSPLEDPRFRDGHSVRGLRLAFLAAFPIPGCGPPPSAVVLDATHPPSVERTLVLEAAMESVTPLLGILLDSADAGSVVASSLSPAAAWIGRSGRSVEAWNAARRAAAARVPVLLRGETGTGKELFARLIHREGNRRTESFVAVNCAALPEALLEGELFGAVRGAFTGAERDRAGLLVAAHGGTLFLDEIGEMPLAMQAKLLRVLQDGRVRPLGSPRETAVDFRVVSATHRDLPAAIRAGKFREDLYWRLAVAEIRVPPLRDRTEDMQSIAESVLEQIATRWGLRPRSLTESAFEKLRTHSWPGNVRELEAVLARALLRVEHGPVDSEHIVLASDEPPAAQPSRDCLEERMIRSALHAKRGSVTAAARSIGWSRQKLYRRMRALGIDRWGERPSPQVPDLSPPAV